MNMRNLNYLLVGLCISLPSWAESIPESATMEVEFELPQVEASIYARPYVAVWIEDKQRNPVRTIQLWVGDDEWLKDLRSWWRKVVVMIAPLLMPLHLPLGQLDNIVLLGMV